MKTEAIDIDQKAKSQEAADRLCDVTKTERDKLGKALYAAKQDLGAQFTSSGKELRDALDNYVRICPWKSVAIAAGTAFLFGKLMGGRR